MSSKVNKARVCVVCNKTGELFFCSKCNLTAYCSRECQLLDWKVHKKTCGKSIFKVVRAIPDSVTCMIARDDVRGLEQALDTGQVHINSTDRKGLTVLMLSGLCGSLKCLELLLRRSANVNDKDNYGYTTLMIACEKNKLAFLKLLFQLDQNVKVNDKNHTGLTPLMIACEKGHIEVFKLLLSHDADVNDKDNNGFYI